MDSALLVVLTILFGTVWSRWLENTSSIISSTKRSLGVCMLNYWFSSNDGICLDNYNYSRFKLKGKCRSEKWEVYLCGGMTIEVVLAQVQFLDCVTCPLLL